MAETIRSGTEASRKEAEYAKRQLRRARKDSADKWMDMGVRFHPDTGVLQRLWYNVETEEISGQRKDMYLSEILDRNKDEYAASMNGTGKAPALQKVASIPMGVFMDNFQSAYYENDFEHVKKMLNDPDNAKFRTNRGRL